MHLTIKILTFLLSLSFLVIVTVSVSEAQETNLSLSGHVIDELNGNPIVDHLVHIHISGAGFSEDHEFLTNDDGFYGNDSIQAPPQGLIIASTLDCNNDEHIQEEPFDQTNTVFSFDFIICTDSIPQEDCENWFWYETWNMIDFTFMGDALPPADSYFWDFGDGNTGYGQLVDHSYNMIDLVYVTLITFTFDPATGDSCVASSTQELWVGNNSNDCIANFEHEVDSSPTGNYIVQFTDLSIGEPTNWLWDFGDGTFSEEQNPEHLYYFPDTYFVCLTIYGDSSNCYDMFCEELIVGSGGEDCENWFWYETIDSVTFNFFGESIPFPADWYMWDFGDGNTGTGQNIVHSFDSSLGDVFLVSLTSYFITPGTNDTCFAESIQEVIIGNQSGCDNWFWYETSDHLTFDFFGESLPIPADEWHWDFGDGNIVAGQFVTHTFDPNQGNEFNVSLYTATYDPLYGDSCYAISNQWILVGDTTSCLANFYYVQDSLDEFTLAFFDSSSGVITNRHWDFGDGTTSEEANPVHIFPGSGVFHVCLSVFSDSLGSFCSDTYCQDIVIDYSIQADFVVSLDTLSGLANIYQFIDSSIGNANTWLWDFGDGNSSTSQNATYQYAISGTYEVCLEVSRNFPGFGIVSDTYCQTINTPNYFDFGGQVFMSGFPLNNSSGDTTIVDTGIAYLYRKYENNLIAVDTNMFYNYGYYWFSKVREGDYILKVGLTENSLNYQNVATTYYENEIHWDKANTLHLIDTNYYVNIDLIELVGIEQGPGSVSGFLTASGKDFINPLLLSEIEILLFDNEENPLTFTYTDGSGNFAFENIPLGIYKLYAEATGFITFESSVLLDENNPIVENINLELYEQTIGTDEYLEEQDFIGNIYPNPVNEIFSLDIELEFNTELLITIFNINGLKVSEQKISFGKGLQVINLNGEALARGVYLLSIISKDREIIETRKFIK